MFQIYPLPRETGHQEIDRQVGYRKNLNRSPVNPNEGGIEQPGGAAFERKADQKRERKKGAILQYISASCKYDIGRKGHLGKALVWGSSSSASL